MAFFSLIGTKKKAYFSLLFANASAQALSFFYLIRVLKGRCAILKMDASDPNPNILFSY
jgi:hypothetical protein